MEHVSSVRPTGKFPEKVENLKRRARFPCWNFRTECRVPFTFLVVCTSSRSTVGHRHLPGFTTKWNNFLPIGNSTFAIPPKFPGFFPKWKAPRIFGSFHWKIPGTNGNSEKVIPFSRLRRSEWKFAYHLQVS